MSVNGWEWDGYDGSDESFERLQAQSMTCPVRCTCGAIYDLGKVTVTSRYLDCSVWKTPCCGKAADDRKPPWGIQHYTEIRKYQPEYEDHEPEQDHSDDPYWLADPSWEDLDASRLRKDPGGFLQELRGIQEPAMQAARSRHGEPGAAVPAPGAQGGREGDQGGAGYEEE